VGIETVVALALGAGSAAYSAKRSRDQQKRTEKHAEREMAALDAQRRERESLTAMDQSRQEARKRQRQLMIGAFGRQSTMLTGSLGVQGEATTARKTLLGA